MNKQEIIAYIKEVQFGYLATLGKDNQPRVRPVSVHCIYNNCLYFFTFGQTNKVKEMESNPQVEIVWSKLSEQSQLRIAGEVALETDQEIHQQFIADNPMVTKMLPPEARHLFRLYRFSPENVAYADGFVPYKEATW